MNTASGVVPASTKAPCLVSPPFPCRTLIPLLSTRAFSFQQKRMLNVCLSSHTCKDEIKQPNGPDQEDLRKQPNGPEQEDLRSRRSSLLFLISSGLYASSPPVSAKTKTKSPYDEKRLLEQNRKIQEANNAPRDFPSFVREGFQVKVVLSDSYVKRDSGLIYLDVEVGKGDCPTDGQQVTFHYVGYNESGRRIDSTYLQGSPAKIRMGTNSLVPGFEEGIRDMRPGGKRRLIIPPELGPPVGPSTFFSSKQFEVFDVELLSIQSCQRRTVAFYSDVVCT